jgi:heme-degrading monooxygenase HmoA
MLRVAPERQDEFERDAVSRGRAILQGLGAHSVVVARGIEDPSSYLLLVEWDSVGAHVSIVENAELAAFRERADAFYAAAPSAAHFEPVA